MWRQGVGATLIAAATHEARRRGLALMVIANPHALDFYRRCGFLEEGIVQTRFGPGIRMSR
jgi:GNAT superfamily N-acetyltransferase